HDGADVAVGLVRDDGEERGARRGAAAHGGREERSRGETKQRSPLQREAGSSTCTTNSVPRTPITAEGVRIFIDSGACFTILPDTAASLPCLRLPSNSPA